MARRLPTSTWAGVWGRNCKKIRRNKSSPANFGVACDNPRTHSMALLGLARPN